MAHNISFSDEEYQKAAEKWRQQLLLLPMLSCKDSLRFMTGIPGIRNKEHVGTAKSNAQFGPYKADKNSSSTTEVKYRELETFFGNVCEDFEPNSVITMLLGQNASFLGEGQKTAPSAKLVIASVLKSLGESLHNVLFTAKRNAEGDTSADLFNGFITIADAEVTAENISEAKGNLLKITTGFSEADALDVASDLEVGADSGRGLLVHRAESPPGSPGYREIPLLFARICRRLQRCLYAHAWRYRVQQEIRAGGRRGVEQQDDAGAAHLSRRFFEVLLGSEIEYALWI